MGDQTRMRIRHFVFVTDSSKPSPTGAGSEAGWLQYYKLDSDDDDEVFIPWEEGYSAQTPESHDVLWMQIDDDVVACAAIARVMPDLINNRIELWFKGGDIMTVEGAKGVDRITGSVEDHVGAEWTKHITT